MSEQQQQAKHQERTAEVEIAVSKMLRIGIVLAGLVIVVGLILFLVTGDSGYPEDTFPTSLPDIFQGVLQLKSVAIIEVGLILLILTPVFRVFVSMLAFIHEKDYRFVVISIFVLIILAISFVLGKVGT
ncbi:DUF1634 domain-containing protein [Paenibacillus lentus]|uniref:DUF1634 domain-containing protein n=1 Tax=Paenibacillus lentus TaxID=1338368 RepID=A0A3S8RQA9_9BACL|nr:DUF1634 domain-containing protein [Paenibacillus lentus]AZK45003.1 DUF1634 domain-containing protein [Paenibacillus lentus]